MVCITINVRLDVNDDITIADWIKLCLDTVDEGALEWIFVLAWSFWNCRNHMVFKQKKILVEQIMQQVHHLIKCYKEE